MYIYISTYLRIYVSISNPYHTYSFFLSFYPISSIYLPVYLSIYILYICRKLCHLLADIDEWGQIVILNILTRYGRTQFEDPSKARATGVKKKQPKSATIKYRYSDSESGNNNNNNNI